MKNIALIFFEGNEDKQLKRISIISVFRKLKKLFAFKIIPVSVKKLEAGSDLAIYAVKLPYALNDVKNAGRFTRNKINKCILKFCTENTIDKCIIPAELDCFIDRCEKSCFTGRIIYTALAINVLEYICAQKHSDIRKVDIAIIQGDKGALPYIFIKRLSPIVKFVTLVTNDRELMEKEIEEVCDETGLSVRITNDVESVLKSSDVVINFGNLKSYGIKNRFDSNAIVINYGEFEEQLLGAGNTIITGIDVGFGDKYANNFEDDIFNFYSHIEVAEIVLVNKSNLGITDAEDLAEYSVMDNFIKHFKEEGFYIKACSQTQNILKN
ncbi:hypothetical protein [Acetivibrio cellulolyticus]|uniref:hypothetical protein n=1 Tax=Acetivibrio cellulolyticus TaxID=35830 RepID=UPI0001E2BE62|nr:hypothetical protein [Acetivibrio cellulolyticus]